MKHIALLVLAVLLAGCPRTSPPTGATSVPGASMQAGSAVPGEAASRLASRTRGVARLPDRGELLAYPAATVTPRSGGRAWHRAELSEAHALRAIFAGSLHLRTPAGEPLEFVYARHVEHPSGDWTWVGRPRGGDAARELILTFGAKAVFGSIPRAGQVPLQVTTRNGATWVVEGDAATAAADAAAAVRTRGPDYLVPPKGVAGGEGIVAKAAADEAVVAAVLPQIDLVLGYTTGFAASLGGQSQALTRLNFLVEVTNQAYLNSQVDGRVRLVHALQVDYPDATDNEEALTQVTGHSGSSSAPVPAALQPLRQARETHGADLVALVRKFNRPENDGCGIAWMIGGGQSGIRASDAPFGYAVVSDGNDRGDDGKTYFCRDETLAHELGHNLGSQHDRATATDGSTVKYGVFAWSFGHKTAAGAGNFYTIMAYGDSGQATYRVFSNPDLATCGGFACGVVNQADNARSLRATLPIVAGFRASVTPTLPGARVRGDFDGDRRSDLLWRNGSTGANTIWLSANAAARRPVTTVLQPWQVVGTDDFDGDGAADILWRNAETGANTVWRSGLSSQRIAVAGVADGAWRVAGTGDFDGDGKADILWRNGVAGANAIWRSGDSATRQTISSVATSWAVAAVADFNGDGRDDIAWRNHATGANSLWPSADAGAGQYLAGVGDQGWQVAGAGDFDGDGRADLAWRNTRTGANSIWYSAKSSTSRILPAVSLPWRIELVGDLNGDGHADLLWRNANGGNTLWLSATGASQALAPVPGTDWVVAP